MCAKRKTNNKTKHCITFDMHTQKYTLKTHTHTQTKY